MTPSSRVKPDVLGWLTWCSVVIGVVLRLTLACLNTEANDDHMPVIRTIAFEHRFPAVGEQWESFQPKLYHTTAALVLRTFDVQAPAAQVRIAQLIGCLAGLLTLVVAIRFFQRADLSPGARTAAIAFVSLNPALIGINAQATNDSFVILFGTVALAYGVSFFRDLRIRDFAIMTAAALATGLSKGNGLVTIIACLLMLCVAAVVPRRLAAPGRRARMGRFALVFGLVVLPAVWFLTPLHSNLRDAGTPFVTNWPKSPPAPLFHETASDTFRPGITSIVYGLLTFRFTDLLRHPYNTHGRQLFNANRTSLWTELYAHTFFLHFDTYPPSWMSIAPAVQALGRVQLVLGLVPAVLLMLGLGGLIDRGWMWARHSAEGRFDPAAGLLTLTAFGYLAFLAVYAVELRDYSTMKAIFVFPAITAFTFVAAREYDTIVSGGGRVAALTRWVSVPVSALLFGFVVDVTWIIIQLAA